MMHLWMLHILLLTGGISISFAHNVNKRSLSTSVTPWPNAVVPYELISPFTAYELGIIYQAITDFHSYTPIRFWPRTTHTYWLKIQYATSNDNCGSAHLGRMSYFAGQGQPVQLNFALSTCITSNQPGTVYHELMHALGIVHEHQRTGRDQCVSVGSNCCSANNIAETSTNNYNQPYDYASVMHYSSYSCSCFGSVVLTPLTFGVTTGDLGQHYWWTQIDVNKLSLMYGYSPPTIPTDPKWESVICSGGGGPCFHGDNSVMTPGGVKPVREVVVGDAVLSVDEEQRAGWQRVYMVGKAWPDADMSAGQYVNITSGDGRALVLTRHHLLYRLRGERRRVELVEAGAVAPADLLLVHSAGAALAPAAVTGVAPVPRARGAYSLDVMGSKPIVSGVLASSHTTGIDPAANRGVKWLLRMLYACTGYLDTGHTPTGMPTWLAHVIDYINHVSWR